MLKLLIVLSVSLFASVSVEWAIASHDVKRPNVIVILVDDLGISDVGCYGSEIKTPNLDALAANGIKYTQFYNTGRCWPTRSALMTGFYAQQIGRDRIPGKEWGGARGKRPSWAPLVSVELKQRGYRCYHSGKWHIDGKVLDNGFDHSYRLNDHDRFFYPRNHLEDDKKLAAIDPSKEFYTTTHIANHAIKCLEAHESNHADKPFFQYIAFTAPHFPLHAPAGDIEKYKGVYDSGWEAVRKNRWKKIFDLKLFDASRLSKTERDLGPPYHLPKHLEKLGSSEVNRPVVWDSLTDEQKKFQAAKMMVHAAMVDRIDQEIGRLLNQLKKMKRFDDTLIMFLSDNGASAEIMVRGDGHDRKAPMGSGKSYLCLGPGWSTTSNTPFRKHKSWVHEGGISTPLIVHWPHGIKAKGEKRKTVGHVIDIVPTLLELSTNKNSNSIQSGKNKVELPGESLVKSFASDQKTKRTVWWAHDGHRAIRVGDWKLVATQGKKWELYDLSVDRAETFNLVNEHPYKVRELAEVWDEMSAQFISQSKPPRKSGNGKKSRNK